MSKVFQHVQHEATRLANEVIVRGRRHNRRAYLVRRGDPPLDAPRMPNIRGLRAVGSIAYASIYMQRENIGERGLPDHRLEYLHPRHGWLTCSRSLQRRSFEEARNLARMPNHRLVVRVKGTERYEPL